MFNKVFIIFIFCFISNFLNAQWEKLPPVKGAVSEIFELDGLLYCVNIGGLFESKDNGKNWSKVIQLNSPKVNLFNFKLFNAHIDGSNLYWSFNGTIFKTEDKGKNWNIISKLNSYIDNFWVRNHEIIISQDHKLYSTADDGATWNEIITNTDTIFNSHYQHERIDSTYFIKYEKGIFKSIDNCRTWKKTSIPNDFYLMNISRNIIFATKKYGNGFYYSNDLGETWIEKKFDETPEYLSVYNNVWLVATTNRNLYKSEDGGNTFIKLPSDNQVFYEGGEHYYKVYINSNSEFFAPSTFGLSISKDKGQTWLPSNNESFSPKGCWGIKKIGNNLIGDFDYRVAEATTLCISEDFGVGWNTSHPLVNAFDYQILNNYTYCLSNYVYYTVNQGKSWFKMSVDTFKENEIIDIEFNENIFYVATENSLFKSKDKGNSWQKAKCNGLDFTKLSKSLFKGNPITSNSSKLFALVNNRIVFSEDEGENWKPLDTGLPNFIEINRLLCIDNLIIANNFFEIIISNDNGLSWKSIKNNLIYNFVELTILRHNNKFIISGIGLPVHISDEKLENWYKVDETGLDNFVDNYGIAVIGDYLLLAQRPTGLYKTLIKDVEKVSNKDISSSQKQNTINIFPNPVKDVLNIDIEQPIDATILDMDGKLILHPACPNQKIDVSVLKSGNYILKIKNKTREISQQFVKE